jgi:hypothetical protein
MHAVGSSIVDCFSIPIRNSTAAVEESAVEIQSQKTYRHKRRTK